MLRIRVLSYVTPSFGLHFATFANIYINKVIVREHEIVLRLLMSGF
jgi:hypothetical protein